MRDMLDRSEVNHRTEFINTRIGGAPNIVLKTEFGDNADLLLVIEFDADGKFVRFDVEEAEE
jgi:hypothetical protein